jgi:hypothetical protein
MADSLVFEDPEAYSKDNPVHMAVYAKNGIGKTTFAGDPERTGLNTVLIDCSDAGAVTLRKVKSNLKIVRIRSIREYLDTINGIIGRANEFDLLVADTITGLQSLALREVKGKGNFEMNQRKWGLVASRVIECIAETRNFPKDVIYLVQEKKSGGAEDEADEIKAAITPSIDTYLSSCVDWVGRLTLEAVDGGKGEMVNARFLDFRITENMEAKDRASLFPKRLKNPTYRMIRKRIIDELQGESNVKTGQR